MPRSLEEIAVLEWVEAALPSLEAVIYARQDSSSPRPALPYATVRLVTDRDLPLRPHKRTTDVPSGSLFVEERYYLRESTARIDIYGDDSRALAKSLRYSLDDDTIKQQLWLAGIAIVGQPLSQIDLSTARDRVAWEPRTQIDFTVRYYEQVDGEVAVIENITHNVVYN